MDWRGPNRSPAGRANDVWVATERRARRRPAPGFPRSPGGRPGARLTSMHRTPHTDAGRAWRELLDLLRDADQTFLAGPRADLDALGVAEGYRHLTHLLCYAFDLYLEADAERPAFTPLASATRKMLGDNVDSRYFFAPLRGDRRYRIRGRRGNEVYLPSASTAASPTGNGRHASSRTSRSATSPATPTAASRLTLGPDAQRPNGIQLGGRRRLRDLARVLSPTAPPPARARSPSKRSIRSRRRRAVDDAWTAHGLRAVTTFVRETLQFTPLPGGLPPNLLGPAMAWNPQQPGWGTPDNVYSLGLFRARAGRGADHRRALAALRLLGRAGVEPLHAVARLPLPPRLAQPRPDRARARRLLPPGRRRARPRHAQLDLHRRTPRGRRRSAVGCKPTQRPSNR